jgi:hypothetical protein
MDDIEQRARLYEIKYNTMYSAKRLVEYFILNRLMLAGYGCKLTFKCNFENIQLIRNQKLVFLLMKIKENSHVRYF